MKSRKIIAGGKAEVTGVNRLVAGLLSLIWLSSGLAGLYLGAAHRQWMLVALSLLALCYSALWLRVVLRSRLLSWQRLVFPWRMD